MCPQEEGASGIRWRKVRKGKLASGRVDLFGLLAAAAMMAATIGLHAASSAVIAPALADPVSDEDEDLAAPGVGEFSLLLVCLVSPVEVAVDRQHVSAKWDFVRVASIVRLSLTYATESSLTIPTSGTIVRTLAEVAEVATLLPPNRLSVSPPVPSLLLDPLSHQCYKPIRFRQDKDNSLL